jgi:hypothetical protein
MLVHGCKGPCVHADHRDLACNALNSQRVLQWRLFLEEHHPTFCHVKGTNSALVADALSWPLRQADQSATGPVTSLIRQAKFHEHSQMGKMN